MAVTLFFCYAHEDEALLNKLKVHLRPLERQGLIDVWHDRNISAGMEWGREIDRHLSNAQIILLLVSPDFLASDYCYTKEMNLALQRHERGEATVIPIILRPVYWQGSPLNQLQALPTDAKPVVSSQWHNWDEAFFNVAEGIRKVAERQNVSVRLNLHNPTSQDLIDQEGLDRASILTRLRKLYVLSHDNINIRIIAGIDPLPKEWVEEELEKMGETWRQDVYYVNLDDDINGVPLGQITASSSANLQRGSWQEIVTAKLQEFMLLWTFSYGKNSEKLINPFLSELQTKLNLISEQLIRLLSWNSSEIPKDVINNIGGLAARLENLGRMQFFIDGGLSVNNFNALGDNIVKDVENLIEQLNNRDERKPWSASASRKGHLFQDFISELLQNLGYKDVIKPEQQDIGYDLQAVYPIHSSQSVTSEQMWAVQIKYTNQKRQLSIEMLHQLIARTKESKADKVLLVTNTTSTSVAREFAAKSEVETWDVYKLLSLLERFPELERKYSEIIPQLRSSSPNPLITQQESLIVQLTRCQPGQQDCYKYEEICMAILTEAFVPPLKKPSAQARTQNGLEIRDGLFPLRGAKQGWEEIRQEFDASFLLCEFKNYTEPFDKNEVNQTRNYLKHTIGRIGIIFSRKGASVGALKMRNSVFGEERKVILFFEDKHLIELLKMKENGQNPLDIILDAINVFFISYE